MAKKEKKAEKKEVKKEPAFATSVPAREDMEQKAKWALDDIIKAEMHKRDPKLMKHVKKVASHHKNAINSIQDLRDKANSMPHGGDMMEEEDEEA